MAAVILSARGLTRHFGGLRAVDGVDFDLAQGEIHALIGPNGAGKITSLTAHARVRAGIAYTFQITSIYPRLPVFDNAALAVQRGNPPDLHVATMAALSRTGLDSRAQQLAGTLSYGHQRLLEIAMGLALAPRVLILDEPTQGLAASEIEGFKTLIRALPPATTVLLIEHNMEVVMDLADRITVLNFGQRLATGTPAEIRANPAVQAAYLGTPDAAA
jgi:branched-chain amino acid transport system ATP-binding protein